MRVRGAQIGSPGAWPAAALLFSVAGLAAAPARVVAVPPAAVASAASLPDAHWVEHRVVRGERLSEIGERYAVSTRALIRWNKLDEKRPVLRAGQNLRVRTTRDVLPREQIRYRVRRGDSWYSIAKRFGVEPRDMRTHWNPGHASGLREGERIVLWVEARRPARTDSPEQDATAPSEGPQIPIVEVDPGARSVGSPDRGRLRNGMQLPVNTLLYTIRNPAHSYGSSHTIEQLQKGIAEFRQRSGYSRELVINDLSLHDGGRFRPHRSHRSGRDVDVQLPIAWSARPGTVPRQLHDVDWNAAWQLVKALVDTGQVRFIFLSRSRQRRLREAALRAGASPGELDALIQFPRSARTAVVRHSRGHVKHIHVRFNCGPDEPDCVD